MSRLLQFFGFRSHGSDQDSSPLVEETKALRASIEGLANNVHDLVSRISEANNNPNPSRNPIEDMARGRYKGMRREH